VTAVVSLTVASPVEAWQAVGLRVVGGRSWVGGVCLQFVAPVDGRTGIVGWSLVGSPHASDTIDGLSTQHVPEVDIESWEHPLGAIGIDHVVVMTSSIERTCGAIEQVTGEPLKRIREAGPVRQGFHRLGPLIVEVVESDRVEAPVASFWGFVLVVDDLDAVVGRLGDDVVSAPRDAVQPGRRIASIRSSAGLGLPLALMPPHR
jgi:hypothetical protein